MSINWDELPKDSVEYICKRIIKSAVDEYRFLCLWLEDEERDFYRFEINKELDEIEEFFESDYCKMLTNYDGKEVLNELKLMRRGM